MDPRTGAVYVADISSAAATILNGSRCDATITSGCRHHAHDQAVGSQPQTVAVNPRTGTAYVTQTFQAGSMSIFKATRQ